MCQLFGHATGKGRVGRHLVVATGLGRVSMEHDEQRNTWFATYGARVERVCARWVD
jgi:hypothetical protein